MSLIHADGYKCTKGSKFQTSRDGSCYQRALANATGIDFDTIYQNSIRAGVKRPGRGGSNVWKFNRADRWNSLAIASLKCTGLTDGFEAMPSHLANMTINQFVKRFPVGSYVVVVRGHALAIVNGTVFDNKDRTSGRHRVKAAVVFHGARVAEKRDDRRHKLELQAEKLEANFKIYTGRTFALCNLETVEMVKSEKSRKAFGRVPVKVWALLDRHAFQLKQFGPLY